MNKMDVIQSYFDIEQEIAQKNYTKVTEYANSIQRELIRNWQAKDSIRLEKLILLSRNILDCWLDSIARKKLQSSLVRCGAWVGTLEVIEKLIYEKNMDLWSRKRIKKEISSIKHFTDMIHILEVKGVMTHSELAKELHLNHYSTLTEIVKKVADYELIDVRKAGKYNLYSLTDAGIRYAKQMRAGENRQDLLRRIIDEYELQVDERQLSEYLQSMDEGIMIKKGQSLKVKMDSEKSQNVKVDSVFRYNSNDEEKNFLALKTTKKMGKEMLANYEKRA